MALKDVSKEVIANKKQEIKKIKGILKEKEESKKALEKYYQILTKLADFLDRKKKLEGKFNELKTKEPIIKEKERLLKQAEEIAPLAHIFKEYEELKDSIPKIERLLKDLQNKETELKESWQLAEKQLKEFAETLPQKLEKLAHLEENARQVQKLKKDFTEKQKQLEENKKQLDENKQALKYIAHILNEYRTEKQALLVRQKRAKKTLESNAFNEEEKRTFNILQKHASHLGKLKGWEEEIAEFKEKIEMLKKEKQDCEIEIKKTWQKWLPEFVLPSPENAVDTLEDLKAKCEEALKALDKVLEDFRQRHLAVSLAIRLKHGQPCPVCGSPIHPKPAHDEEITVKIEDTQREKEKFEQKMETLNQLRKKMKPFVEKLVQVNAKLEDKHQQYQVKYTDFKKEIEEILGKLGLRLSIKKLESLFDELQKKFELQNKASEELRDIAEKLQQQEEKIQKERRKAEGHKKEIKHLLNLVGNLEKELVDIRTEIIEKIGKKSPEQLLNQVKEERQKLEEKRQELEEIRQKAQNGYLNIKTELDKTKEQLRLKRQRKQELTEILIEEVKKRHLDLASLKRLLLSEKEMLALKQAIEKWKKEIENIKGQLRQITTQINDLPIQTLPLGEPEATFKKLEKLKEEIRHLQNQEGALENEVKNLEEKLNQKQKLETEIKKDEEEIRIASTLKDCLYGKALVKFAARHLFRNILHEANLILKDIIGERFIIQMSEESFNFSVYDPSVGHVRPIETLSGGETFLVSFSLALALSSYVQKTKARPIHFFFIDEGFGSLDEDLLDAVAEVLNQLKQQERLVGIITHLEKFKQLLPAYILVKKDLTPTSIISIHA
ncbi:MAG: SMC family ATPase [Deltaproteobacteria bacterium]|nr:SMC family ATPase [Deltaproteobacteria bacterium]